MLQQKFIDEMKQKLLAAKQKLEGGLAGLTPHEELGEDLDSNVQEVEDDEVSQDMIAKIKLDLEKIDKALEKIQAGTYGTDDDGKEIPQDRLNAIPWADKSI
jgi:RNA polymerase-binding transcription factor DksA